MKDQKEKIKKLQATVPEQMHTQLKLVAFRKGETVQNLLRRIISLYLKRAGGK